jgi:hypothetical protein
MSRRAVAVPLAAVPIVAAAAATLALLHGHRSPAPASAATRPHRSPAAIDVKVLPTPVQPAFTPVATALPRAHDYHFAPILHATVVRRRPAPGSAPVGRVATRTPEGTENIVPVLGRRLDATGRLWVRVRVPALPTNAVGWVRRDSLGGYGTVDSHLVVDLERLTAVLYDGGRAVFRASIGAGAPAWPTPRGQFYVRDRLTSLDPDTYGPLAFGTSARSRVLTDWPGGGYIGIHGTDQPQLIPGRISHGCIRLRNADILRLGRLMPVGTPVTVR